MKAQKNFRRDFFKKGFAITAGLSFAGIFNSVKACPTRGSEDLLVIGPRTGYTPEIGTLVSMMNYMRMNLSQTVKDMSQKELDFLFDAESNTIGALLMHLGATEKFYQINTFENRQEFNEEEDKIWGAASRLGDEGREKIKGHDLNYYMNMIGQVREETLEKFKTLDDDWLYSIDPIWSDSDGDVNTYFKWYHVFEHESNHIGQMRWLRARAS